MTSRHRLAPGCLHVVGFALAALGAAACADADRDQADGHHPSPLATVAWLGSGPGDAVGLGRLQRVTVASSIAAAENLILAGDRRLFVSGDEGVFEIRRDAAGNGVPVAVTPPATCRFAGMVEVRGVLYANCFASPSSSLWAAALTDAPRFRQIAELPGIVLANGLAADAEGRLYIAATFQDQILRLTLSSADRFRVVTTETWLAGTGQFTNGLKFFRGSLYWTDAGAIRRAALLPDGEAGPIVTLVTQPTFFDDLLPREHAVLVADFLGNRIRAFRPSGAELDATTAPLTNPSAVIRAGRRALLVTEKGANRVSALVQPDDDDHDDDGTDD
jgi:hypothetical protein